ncbi:ABC transporter transmembrane domain-containing protein [Coraliomargarita algicola]|uniref:ABC transporter transmembrane domain-containing protein n=1 Tax=Coraliomargarita algicola TaxID=3092156 RepID=A0ABZ0RIQ3_9BACT|nr:ABC transporter transmembrane domain-containing protein [Coraliomargarita sp. J2-16]WPJ94885.1 ABC transporter transmembrane domain-containing protein [Coraliomargarita sp. J2-16]
MASAVENPSPNKRLLGLLWPHWKSVSIALLGLFLLTAVNLATPMLIGMVFNEVFPQRDWSLLWWVLGGLLGCFLLRNLFFYQSKFTAVQVGENVCFSLRKRLFERIQQLQLSYTRLQSPGQITSKVMNDSMQIQQFIADVLPKTLQAALLFLGILVITYSLNWQLALASTFILPVHLYVFSFFGRRIKRSSRESQERIDFATGSIIETLLGVEVVKGFTGEERGNRAFNAAMEDSRVSHLNSYRYVVLQKVCADLLVGFGMLALIGLGAYQVIGRPSESAMGAGDFIAFFWYIRLLYPTVIDLMSSGAKLSKVGASVDRVYELLDVDEAATEGEGVAMSDMRGDIRFDQVGFSFDGKSNILENVSFKVKAGQVCALTGHSGAGKSTLVSLVPMLLRPTAGRIVIDGVNTRDISTRDLRRNIGVVFQECFLFKASIQENLRYAKARASEKEIRQICVLTGADKFIQRLPNGYHTVVGDGGLALSRGQKQLITITRAVIKDPKILILDEATASLDTELEDAVIPTILNLMQGRTTLMITHNPKLLKHADMEIELSQGRLTSQRSFAKSVAASVPAGRAALSTWLLMLGLTLGALLSLPASLSAQAETVLEEIETQRMRLSYTDPKRCLDVLKIYGISTGITGDAIKKAQLPVVVAMPSTAQHNTIPNTDKSFPLTDADPLNELLIFYDRSKPSQLSRVVRMIREEIDVPARQIMIEAMVLEISETGLERLGVEWNLAGPSSNLTALQMGDVTPNLDNINDQFVVGTPNIFGEFDVDIRALMTDGEAEVLSRPSVLTLDNRMAYINVARKIPIAETKFQGNNNVSTVSFRSETVGIQLAVRPRINEEGQEVSMQVNATVSAKVPNEDVVVLDSQGREVAVAPTISIREVKTYARIANNTPFIIGGLIAKDDLRIKRSVPLLGSLPYIGRAFGSEQAEQLKREVIIVITPYVLPDEMNNQTEALDKIVGRFLPKGEDTFDSFGNELFRDAYRIRDEDVFELNFLIENEHLNELQAQAERAVDEDYSLRSKYPFSSFANGRVPGENILVYRQMYEVIKRIKMDERVDALRSLVFEPKAGASEGFEVNFLEKLLIERAQQHAAGQSVQRRIKSIDDVWDYFEDKALTITYRDYGQSEDLSRALESPVPVIEIVDVPDRAAYEDLFWELNQPDAEGRLRNSIILHDADDMRRLKRAIVLRDTVTLNAVDRTLTLDNFSVGRFLLLPTRDISKIDLVDGEVARLFFLTERYYDALRQALRDASSELESELKAMGIE